MRGDFSVWNKDRSRNFRGTLHQQGRVLLDRDWNAQTEITGEWQETAARDAFGAGVAAVPADSPDSFKVTRAENAGGSVKVFLKKGRAWADGLLAELFRDAEPPALPAGVDAIRIATYLGPPIQAAPLPNAVPSVGDRDAVILETWLEELSPFQRPDLLLEPALGGVDTTERVQTSFQLRLYRMDTGDTCDSIIDDLKDDFSAKGKLTAELKPSAVTDGDCPVVLEGGFTGFEHRLYRIEIADTDRSAPQAYFKWSHFNGGLVGTGDFDNSVPVDPKVVIHGNKNAIVYSGSSDFFLEALDFDTEMGCWKVIYGAKVTLANDGTLSLPTAASDIYQGAIPPAPGSGKRFFRLWNGIERVNDYVAAKKDLPDNVGIMLQFEAEATGKYAHSDFWTFEARAEEIGNPLVLVPNLPPQGIFYHRVPLAEINWTSNNVTGDDIEDCRRPFQPLTKLKTCCTYRVGDGVSSHGDFTKVQDAIDALPKSGGEVCILPGLYEENVVLAAPHNRNIILKGCGRRTVIQAKEYKEDTSQQAAIYVEYGQGITIESLAIEAHEEGIGLLLHGEELTAEGKEEEKYLQDILLSELYVKAALNNAIKGYTAQNLTLKNSIVHIKDVQTRKPAVYLEGDDMLIERTEIRVLAERDRSEIEKGMKSDNGLTNDPKLFKPAKNAAGGLQIGGGSERVRILNNLIINGTGNGISLGRIDLMKDGRVKPSRDPFEPAGEQDPCKPDDGHIDEDDKDEQGFVGIAGPPLYDILIKFNRIYNMGRNGIGVATFFSMGEETNLKNIEINEFVAAGGLIFVSKLIISENRIERCLNVPPSVIPSKMSYLMGYGGIALALAEGLVIRDNFILDNCSDCLEAVCGVFVLAALRVEICRNEITEHLPQDYQKLDPADIKNGPRGGIWLFIAIGQMDIFSGPTQQKYNDADFFRQASVGHAAKIHENVVSVPLGRSLTMTMIGDTSIQGNRFTSQGMVPVDILKLFISIVVNKGLNMTAVLQILSLLASNILIFDLGTFVAYKEFNRKRGSFNKTAGTTGDNLPDSQMHASNNIAGIYRGENEIAWLFNLFTSAGMIQFSDNQCKLIPRNTGISLAFSSIFIAGLADVGFHDNQASCNIPRSLLITNPALIGGTCRVTGNWLKETFFHVAFSGMTFGILNTTTDNQSVHCLQVKGMQYLDRHNLVLGSISSVTGDVAEDAGDKIRELCKRQKSLAIIGTLMINAILRDQDKEDGTSAVYESYIKTSAEK